MPHVEVATKDMFALFALAPYATDDANAPTLQRQSPLEFGVIQSQSTDVGNFVKYGKEQASQFEVKKVNPKNHSMPGISISFRFENTVNYTCENLLSIP
jgi:hypothetical protein